MFNKTLIREEDAEIVYWLRMIGKISLAWKKIKFAEKKLVPDMQIT